MKITIEAEQSPDELWQVSGLELQGAGTTLTAALKMWIANLQALSIKDYPESKSEPRPKADLFERKR